VVSLTAWLIYLQGRAPVSIAHEASWVEKLARCFGEEQNLLPPLEIEPCIFQPVVQLLYWLGASSFWGLMSWV